MHVSRRWGTTPVALAVLVAGSLVATEAATAATAAVVAAVAAAPAPADVMAANAPTHDSPADHSWSAAQEIAVTLTGTGASSSSNQVSVSGSTVRIVGAGTYRLSGSLTNGTVVVDTAAAGIVRLVLDGARIANSSGAALQVLDAEEVMVVAAAGTTSTLTDGTSYTFPDASVTEPDAALFSAADLTLTGTGSLQVTGRYKDGIASKDGLVIDSVALTVTAADDGIRGKDYLVVNGGTVQVTATGGDGLKSTEDADATRGYVFVGAGTVTATSGGDGISAETDVVLSGGTTNVRSGGGSGITPGSASTKGVKAGVLVAVGGTAALTANSSDDAVNSAAVAITGGTLSLATADDAVHADDTLDITAGTVTVTASFEALEALKVTISGGTVTVVSRDDAINAVEEGINEFAVSANAIIAVSGGSVVVNSSVDGLDSNGRITISGGTVVINGPTVGGGEGAIDANGTVAFTGGTLLAAATVASTSAPSASGGQGWVSASLGSSRPAGSVVHVVSASGTRIASFRSSKAIQSVIFSSNQITMGQSYDLYLGGTVSGTEIGGLFSAGSTSGATRVATVTAGTHTGGGWGWPTVTPTATTPVPTTPVPTTPVPTTPVPTTPVPTTPVPTTPVPTTPVPTTSGGLTCTATYATTNSWDSGFQADITVTAGPAAITGWRVTWTYGGGQTVTQSWNTTLTSSGGTVTASNVSYNGALAAGARTSFGLLGNGTPTTPTLTCTAT